MLCQLNFDSFTFLTFLLKFLDIFVIFFFGFLGLYRTILEVGVGLIHVVEQLSFSTIPSILAFEFDLIFGSF